ncbi:hypothetical protein [Phaeobacter inhibens]|uniref:hypothetical protein n=1 Tax=Phaeobacter inhibens TaxID=221822 RepID=UPI0021A75A11|nr:hypothetical protein [Phaeobacter inhibens]
MKQARADAMRYARADLDEALERLKDARQSLTSFRTRTRIVDPEADIQGRMGVMNNLQQQLAEALIQYESSAGHGDCGGSAADQGAAAYRRHSRPQSISNGRPLPLTTPTPAASGRITRR